MSASDRFKKARKLYRDFPFLWAVEPCCSWELDIKVVPLEAEMLRTKPEHPARWWIHYSTAYIVDQINEIEYDKARNLAEAAMLTLSVLAEVATATCLISLEPSLDFRKKILIYRPNRKASLVKMCRNGSFFIGDHETVIVRPGDDIRKLRVSVAASSE